MDALALESCSRKDPLEASRLFATNTVEAKHNHVCRVDRPHRVPRTPPTTLCGGKPSLPSLRRRLGQDSHRTCPQVLKSHRTKGSFFFAGGGTRSGEREFAVVVKFSRWGGCMVERDGADPLRRCRSVAQAFSTSKKKSASSVGCTHGSTVAWHMLWRCKIIL